MVLACMAMALCSERLDPVKESNVDELLVAGASVTRGALEDSDAAAAAMPLLVKGLHKASMTRAKLYAKRKPAEPMPGPDPALDPAAAVRYHQSRWCNMDRHTAMCPLIA